MAEPRIDRFGRRYELTSLQKRLLPGVLVYVSSGPIARDGVVYEGHAARWLAKVIRHASRGFTAVECVDPRFHYQGPHQGIRVGYGIELPTDRLSLADCDVSATMPPERDDDL
ncbi:MULTISPECIES: hypothetical protein [Streptomyces]|uniref:Uncharacterized protein n=2 Tax=Streptomyces TaxID=1883 RepID=A0ABV9J926_9ACTN